MQIRRLAVAAVAALTFTAALAADKKPETKSPPAPAWVERSNANAQVLLKTLAQFNPEFASFTGFPGYDEKTVDLKAGISQRSRAAFEAARSELQKKLDTEKDANVQQDLHILIAAATRRIDDSTINEKYLLPYFDVGQTIFQGEFTLLQDQTAADRRAHALARLKCYVGQGPGCTPLAKDAEARFEEKMSDKNLLGPYKAEVEQHLSNTGRYVEGIRKLYEKYKIAGADATLAELQKQLDGAYARWQALEG